MDENLNNLFEEAVTAYVERMSYKKLVEMYLDDVSKTDLTEYARYTIFHSHNSSEKEMIDFIDSYHKKTMSIADNVKCIVNDGFGIYVPQAFIEGCWFKDFEKSLDPEYVKIIQEGPDHKHYWEAWQDILWNAMTEDGRILCHDGDLFMGTPDEIDAWLGIN